MQPFHLSHHHPASPKHEVFILILRDLMNEVGNYSAGSEVQL